MNATSSPTSRPRHWRKIVAVQAALLVLGVSGLEVGARAWSWIRHEPYDPAETRREALHLLDVNRNFVPRAQQDVEAADAPRMDPDQDRVLHPFLGWETGHGLVQTDDEYQWLRRERTPDDMQILVVGGSVAAGFSVDSLGGSRLRELLSADPRLAGRKLHVMGFGRGGFKEPQQLNCVLYLLGLGFQPEVVINIDGFNEVALGNNNQAEGSHPSFPSAAHWAHLAVWSTSDRDAIDEMLEIRRTQRAIEAWGAFTLDWRLDRSCVLGKLALHRMYKLRHVIVDQFAAYAKLLSERQNTVALRGPALAGGEVEAVEASVQCWKESSRCLADLCRARGIVYLHVLQPTLHDTGSKPLTAKEIANGKASEPWIRGVKLGYPLLRREGLDLRRLGVDFIDASGLFEKRTDDLYYDACHFVRAGHELLAEKIAPELLESLPK